VRQLSGVNELEKYKHPKNSSNSSVPPSKDENRPKRYQCFQKQCKCGYKQSGNYPAHITNHIQYGPSVEAAVGYYSAYQYLPFNRMKQMFGQVFNLPISQGTLVNIVEKLAQKAQPIY